MKMKNNIIIFKLLLFVLIVSSCTSEIETVEQITPTFISNTKTPTVIPTSTSSPTPELDTLIQVEKSCMNLENLPTDLELTGAWIRQDSYPFLENLDDETKYRIPLDGGGSLNTYQGDWSISPNGEWLAYLDTIIDSSNPRNIARTEGFSLKVIHSSGHSLSMGYWPITYQSIQGWVDDQTLLLDLDGRDIVLNPFSGKWYEIESPKWLKEMNLNDSWLRDDKKYSPNLSKVIIHLDTYSELRDFNSGELIFGNTTYGNFIEGVWSPDGIMLAIITSNDDVLHIFEGNKKILSRLLTSFYITNMEWSLNKRRLILETFENVFVLDINEKKIYDICFSDTRLNRGWSTRSFFYPENGRYIISSLYLRDENFNFGTFNVLIDLENMRAYKLHTPRYSDRIGWLKLPER